jgi:undecaprenyl-diphosphatase
MLIFSFTLPIFYDKGKLGVPLLITSAFIGFSLVYMGVHYPSDVIAGALLSTALSILMIQLKPSLTCFLSKLKL